MEVVKVIHSTMQVVLQVHGINAERKVITRRQLKRRYVVLPGAAGRPRGEKGRQKPSGSCGRA
jgi:hypothetical protein